MARIEFLDANGETLAHAEFADDLCRDTGTVGDVREFDITAKVERKGKVSRYLIVAPFNTWSGVVVQAQSGDLVSQPFGVGTLDRVEVNAGEEINMKWRGVSDGTGDKPDESEVEFTVAFEDGSGALAPENN